MSDIRLYNLPVIEDGVPEVEKVLCELLSKYRKGEHLDPEMLDWMDYANNKIQSL